MRGRLRASSRPPAWAFPDPADRAVENELDGFWVSEAAADTRTVAAVPAPTALAEAALPAQPAQHASAMSPPPTPTPPPSPVVPVASVPPTPPGLPVVTRLFRPISQCAAPSLQWIWDGLIARGKLTLLSGEPGVGKSLLALQVAAMVTRGWVTWEDAVGLESTDLDKAESGEAGSETAESCESRSFPVRHDAPPSPGVKPGSVIVFSALDSVGDTVRPRLEAAGADLNRVAVLCQNDDSLVDADDDQAISRLRSFSLERDLSILKEHLRACREDGVDVRLIVIDPIDSLMQSAKTKAKRAEIVERLTEFAEWSNAAVLVIGTSVSPKTSRAGFRGQTVGYDFLANSARSVLMVVQDLDSDDRRLVLPAKLTLSGLRPGLAFSIRQGAVEWSPDQIRLTPVEYLQLAADKLKNPLVLEERSELARVTTWLRHQLEDGGVAATRISIDAHSCEISYATLRRAFKKLNCKSTRQKGASRWVWRLPEYEYDPITRADVEMERGRDQLSRRSVEQLTG